MAQQLMSMRTPSAFAGVANYARAHSGDAAAAAYLALGFAYQQDKRYGDSASMLHQAKQASEVLADYADYLGAVSEHASGNDSAAETLLKGFDDRYPDSIFIVDAPVLEASVLLAAGNTAGAKQVLDSIADEAKDKPNYELAQAKVAAALGQTTETERLYTHLLLHHPLTQEAEQARAKLTAMDAEGNLTIAELRSLGDAYYNAGRYSPASEQYHALARNASLDSATRNSFAVAAAACDLHLKRLTEAQARALADTNDESGARRLDLLVELARDRKDNAAQQQLIEEFERRFPQSPWLADALYVSGSMYQIQKDYARSAGYYSYLAAHFPADKNAAAAHWRGGWLSYRQGLYSDAARIFDDQIRLFPSSPETAAALYWRGRLYEMQDRRPALAATNYKAVVRAYQHYYYAQAARQRLAVLASCKPPPYRRLMHCSRRSFRTSTLPLRRTVRTLPRRGWWRMRA